MRDMYEAFLKRIQKERSVKIYGAGKFAKTLCYLFERNNVTVDSFVVTDIRDNPTELLHHPVVEIDKLKPLEQSSIVVGFENREIMKKTTDFLLGRKVKNIIMVPSGIVNEIYCNFVINESSVESLCEGLTARKRIAAYINDPEGVIVVRYMQCKGVNIEKIYTDSQGLSINVGIPVFSSAQISGGGVDETVLLTMNSVSWQRCYITSLRKSGIEDIILISDKILEKIKCNYRKIMWEKRGFCLIESVNIERNFYAVQKKHGKNVYCWRIPKWDEYPYGEQTLEAIENGKMLNAYEKQFPGFIYLPYNEVPLCEIKKEDLNIEIYMAKYHKDKNVEHINLPDWIIPIQVGRALTDISIAQLCDNTGDNISFKNADYSEGTALYWMWKNTCGQDYIGLFHYRRQMAMGADSLKRLAQYDVLLTLPTYLSKSIGEVFCERFVLESDWNLMMHYIKEYDELYYDTALKYEKEHCYFPCNIFIIRRKYFDEMCSFIFAVLEKVDNYYREIAMVREDRYLGYLVENLLSIYMMHNSGRMKAAYTDMKFYGSLDEEK